MDRDLFREINQLLDSVRRKISLVASKAVVEIVKDSIGLQGLQVSVLTDEVMDEDTEHMQPGGLTHVPLAGAEGVLLSIGGVRDDAVVLCVSHRAHRPKGGQPGETTLYNAGDHKSFVRLLQDGSVSVTSGGNTQSTIVIAADGAVTVTSGDGADVNINGVVIDNDGNVTTPGEVTAMSASPATSVTLSKHQHLTGTGPSNAATPGT